MDLGAIFLLLTVLILVAMFVARPFTGRPRALTGGDPTLSTLLVERDRVLNALQELDFDYILGKIPAEDYPAQRKKLVQRGAQVLRQMDALTPSSTPNKRRGRGERESAEDRIEATVARLRADTAKKPASSMVSDEDLENLIARRRSLRKDKAAGFCPKCGKPIMQSDAFCPSCGHALN
jgi:hypothetical protein